MFIVYYLMFQQIKSIHFDAVILQKMVEMRIFGKLAGNQCNVKVRHCISHRILLQQVLPFNYARMLQNCRPFVVRGVQRVLHFGV
jgi:hypothetical protein